MLPEKKKRGPNGTLKEGVGNWGGRGEGVSESKNLERLKISREEVHGFVDAIQELGAWRVKPKKKGRGT